jgi:hypothetical protein
VSGNELVERGDRMISVVRAAGIRNEQQDRPYHHFLVDAVRYMYRDVETD